MTEPDRGKVDPLAARVAVQAARKLSARRDGAPGVWPGLGMMGLVGWSIVVPTLLGAALGWWLDHRQAGSHSWTLALLVAGLTLGCLNAWHWVAKEDHAMHAKRAGDLGNDSRSTSTDSGRNGGRNGDRDGDGGGDA